MRRRLEHESEMWRLSQAEVSCLPTNNRFARYDPVVASFADVLYLRLIYQRLELVRQAATDHQQIQQTWVAQHRVTAALIGNGWRVPEIADALGVARHRVRYWNDRGRHLGSAGLSLPFPSMEPRSALTSRRLTVADVANCLRVDLATVRRWIKDGTLQATRASDAAYAPWLIEASLLRELGVEGGTMTVQEMAEREGVHPMTVRAWIKSGRLAAVSFKAGGLLRIPKEAQPIQGASTTRAAQCRR